MNVRQLVFFAVGAAAILWARPVAADLVLSFDEPAYSIANIGAAVPVEVLLSQTPAGPQVGPGNELLSAAITLDFSSPAGIAAVLTSADIAPSVVFDASSAGVLGNTATLGMTSLLGLGDLSTPLLLGTFTFTGLQEGTTTISVATLGPGPSFVTVGGNFLDPTAAATATITIVPEPGGLVLAGAAAAALALCGWLRRRVTSWGTAL